MQNDKINSEKKLESILTEFNERMSKEKEIVVSNIDTQLKSLLEQVLIIFLSSFMKF